jgi:hypothetical protein
MTADGASEEILRTLEGKSYRGQNPNLATRVMNDARRAALTMPLRGAEALRRVCGAGRVSVEPGREALGQFEGRVMTQFAKGDAYRKVREMTDFDPELDVRVAGNDITVTLLGTRYSVTYFKRRGSPGLFAKDIVHEDDPRVPMTSAEFLAKVWKVANQKARELGWIV